MIEKWADVVVGGVRLGAAMTVKLNYRFDGKGPHLLLLHAVGVDLTFLDTVAAALARDLAVLRADLRGHGLSPYVPAASLEDFADDVHARGVRDHAPCKPGSRDRGGEAGEWRVTVIPEAAQRLSGIHDTTALAARQIPALPRLKPGPAGMTVRATFP